MRPRKIIIILIKLLAKSCGMKHHLKFDLEKCYTSSSVAQPDAWSANLDIHSLQREHLSESSAAIQKQTTDHQSSALTDPESSRRSKRGKAAPHSEGLGYPETRDHKAVRGNHQ